MFRGRLWRPKHEHQQKHDHDAHGMDQTCPVRVLRAKASRPLWSCCPSPRDSRVGIRNPLLPNCDTLTDKLGTAESECHSAYRRYSMLQLSPAERNVHPENASTWANSKSAAMPFSPHPCFDPQMHPESLHLEHHGQVISIHVATSGLSTARKHSMLKRR